ncbi:FHA domain-containing protein OS=Streptomyces tendae OX=1932 GN=GUR47_30565 PE=4 SV=1 [Streptomyces tendae]
MYEVRNHANSRFCSNCGAPLRAGAVPERASETTSTISISGLEAYDAEVTGQTAMPALSPEAQAAVDALPLGSALLVVRRGPTGSRFLLDGELTAASCERLFLDDVTVRAGTWSSAAARTVRSRSPTSAA